MTQLHYNYNFKKPPSSNPKALLLEYKCPGGESEKRIEVNHKADLTFMVPKKTPHNMDCEANYVLNTCSRVKLECSFERKANGACVLDKAVIKYGGKTFT